MMSMSRQCHDQRCNAYMGTLARPLSSEKECVWARSREGSLDADDMASDGYLKARNERDALVGVGMHP